MNNNIKLFIIIQQIQFKINQIKHKQFLASNIMEDDINFLTNRQNIQNNNSCKDIQQYFESMRQSSHSIKALEAVQRINTKINEEIEDEEISMPNQPQNISKYLHEQRISKQQKKIQQLKLKRSQINITLQYLDMQIRGADPSKNDTNEFNLGTVSGSILTKRQHNDLMIKIRKQRLQTCERRLKLQQSLQKQREKKQQQEKKKHELAIQNDKIQRRKKIQERTLQHKEQQLKKSAEKESLEKSWKNIKNKKFMYQEMEEKYHYQQVMPSLEEKKKRLKEMREMKAFSINEIKLHEQQYLKKKQQQTTNNSRIESSWHYQPPKKSQKLSQLIENQQIEMKKKLVEKKRMLQENIIRQQSFLEYLKQKFPPKVNEKKKQQLLNRVSNLHARKRQSADSKEIGNLYLEEIKKKMPKKRNRKSANMLHIQNSSMMIDKNRYDMKTQASENRGYNSKRSYTNYLKKSINRNYTELRRKKIQKLMQSTDENPEQKVALLNIEYNKLIRQAKQKQQFLRVCKNEQVQQEAIDLLLNSIKAKMGIIKIYSQ